MNSPTLDLGQNQIRIDGLAHIIGAGDLENFDLPGFGVHFQVHGLGADCVVYHGPCALTGLKVQIGHVRRHELALSHNRASGPAFEILVG